MPFAPEDSDDTAFVLQTYGLLGKKVPADGLLGFYQADKKAFTTFRESPPTEVACTPSVKNNSGVHPEVDANIFGFLQETPFANLIDYGLIAGAQTADGWWRSFFYPGRYYGTYMSLRLLCKTGSLPESRRKGLSFLLGSRNPDGSWGSPGNVYETCLALNALAACGARGEAFRSGIARLIAWQRPDGSWRDERAVIWEFTYRDKPIIWRAHDARGVVTTALAVKALRSAQDGGAQ